jgi:hypothetical protein
LVRPATRFEILLGRSLALCVHPYTAWRVSGTRIRAGLVLGYAAAGYVTGLLAIAFFI